MVDIEKVLAELTLEEKAALTAGDDFWSTVAIERLDIPKVRLTDGPNGARGATFPGGGAASSCIPCGSAIGASWDHGLAEELGLLVGREALDRGCRVLLAPTVNLHRNVLAGRNFECHSEDPLLSGKLAAAFVRGVQAAGVIATVKHLVANESEFERATISSVVDERSLRELYLLPFELAVREGGALAVMTAYNRLNGKWLTQRPEVLQGMLRKEWGFQGLVMTDWFAIADSQVSLGAGLDLEMPGPGRALGANLVGAVEAGEVDEADVDGAVRHLLGALERAGALDAPTPPVAPKAPTEDDVALVRRAAASSMVLLRNDGVLPLAPEALRSIAIIGVNAADPRIMGGGSAEVTPHRVVSPLDALREVLPDGVQVDYERGCEIDMRPRAIGTAGIRAPEGFSIEYFAGSELAGDVEARETIPQLRILALDPPAGLSEVWSARVRGSIEVEESGAYELALAQLGRARVFVDGALVIDGFVDPPPPGGTEFFRMASEDALAEVELAAGRPYELVLEFATADGAFGAFRVGFRPPRRDDLLDRAASLAAAADVAVVVVGTSSEWETESHDRSSFQLPGAQDELVRRVASVNPRTVVVVNAGSAVDLPWADDVGAVLQCWFGGHEMGPALADVLTGVAEPGGRLATTVPLRVEHSPSWGNYPGENGEVRYGEGVFMGYRGYEHTDRPVRFPFGHGLGYTTFSIEAPTTSSPDFTPGASLTVSVRVTNGGTRRGSEVLQLYVAPGSPRLARPAKELKAFQKVELDPGESTVAELVLDDRSFAYWDPGQPDWQSIVQLGPALTALSAEAPQERREPGWQVDPGSYEVLVGRSSSDIVGRCTVEVRS